MKTYEIDYKGRFETRTTLPAQAENMRDAIIKIFGDLPDEYHDDGTFRLGVFTGRVIELPRP